MNLDFIHETGFGKFLVEGRVIPFIKMQVLMNYLDKEFSVKHRVIFVSEYEDDEKDFGVLELKRKITGRELFDTYLARLGIMQIDAVALDFFHMKRKKEIKNIVGYSMVLQDETFETEGLIIKEKEIISDKEINIDKEFFKKFVEENKDKKTIDHEIYVPMLMKMFPGMIKIRSLEA